MSLLLAILHMYCVVMMLDARVLIHPNTGDSLRDHTELATWMGRPYALLTEVLKPRQSAPSMSQTH